MLTDIANRSRFDRHAADCPRCPIVAETTRKTVELYKRFHPCEVPAAREARVLAAIRARALVKPKLGGSPRKRRQPALASARPLRVGRPAPRLYDRERSCELRTAEFTSAAGGWCNLSLSTTAVI
jgi:hypothetical protein